MKHGIGSHAIEGSPHVGGYRGSGRGIGGAVIGGAVIGGAVIGGIGSANRIINRRDICTTKRGAIAIRIFYWYERFRLYGHCSQYVSLRVEHRTGAIISGPFNSDRYFYITKRSRNYFSANALKRVPRHRTSGCVIFWIKHKATLRHRTDPCVTFWIRQRTYALQHIKLLHYRALKRGRWGHWRAGRSIRGSL